MTQFFEAMFFSPKWYHYVVMVLFFPLSLVYGTFMFLRRVFTSKNHFSIPIISVGNLQIGGSGKTPFLIALASKYEDVTIISRGYGRESTGLVEVSYHGKIVVDVKQSGDEPMLIAQSLPHASVIVSENREIAIELAMREGAKLVILDDGFNRVEIEKYEILLEPACMPNSLPLPAGPLREFQWTKRVADLVLKEERDFKRVVSFENLSEKMLLVTAISNPARLDAFLPDNVVGKVYLEDHAYFDESFLKEQMQKYGATTLLVTQKDAVKMQDFKLPLSLMKLKLEITDKVFTEVNHYINHFIR
jgi:tetraacyldisaccharide 4'-kinase